MKNIYSYLSQLDKFTQYKKPQTLSNYFFNNNLFSKHLISLIIFSS